MSYSEDAIRISVAKNGYVIETRTKKLKAKRNQPVCPADGFDWEQQVTQSIDEAVLITKTALKKIADRSLDAKLSKAYDKAYGSDSQ